MIINQVVTQLLSHNARIVDFIFTLFNEIFYFALKENSKNIIRFYIEI